MDYFKLTAEQGFLVGQKALIIRDNQLLLLKAKQWDLPGGLLDFGEDLHTGLLREIHEETALTVNIGSVFASSGVQQSPFQFADRRIQTIHFVMLAYRCEYVSGDVQLSHEHTDYAWVNRDNLSDYPCLLNSQFAVDAWLREID